MLAYLHVSTLIETVDELVRIQLIIPIKPDMVVKVTHWFENHL